MPHERQFVAVKEKQCSRANEHENGQRKKLAMIVDGRERNAELRQVAEDGSAHSAQGQHGAIDDCPRHKQQDGRDQFHGAAADPAPGLGAKRRKDVHRFSRAGELEEQCLQQNHRRDDSQRPTQKCETFVADHVFPSEN